MKKTISFIGVLAILNVVTIKAYASNKITYTYNDVTVSKIVEPKANIFDNAYYFSSGTSGNIRKISEDNWKNSYMNLDQYKYITYEYEDVVNSRIKMLKENIIHVGAGNSHSHTETLNEEMTITYEESVAESMSESYSIKAKASIPVEAIKIDAEVDGEVTNSISRTIRQSQAYTYGKTHTFTDYLYASSQATDYSWEIRGNFKVYITYLYKINYNVKVETHRTWYKLKKYHTYSYTPRSLEYEDYFYTYKLIDRANEGFFKYSCQPNGLWKYDDIKYDGITYLD